LRDETAFICHAFARPAEMKEKVVVAVARRKRFRLEQLLRVHQGLAYRGMENTTAEVSADVR
jgi:GTP cyclohydrolase II